MFIFWSSRNQNIFRMRMTLEDRNELEDAFRDKRLRYRTKITDAYVIMSNTISIEEFDTWKKQQFFSFESYYLTCIPEEVCKKYLQSSSTILSI